MKVLGSTVDMVQNPEVLALMERWIGEERDKCHFMVNTGFHGAWVAHQDPEFKKILASCDLWSPDGIALVWLARLQRKPIRERATSAELMKMFFAQANHKGYRSFFYGDTDETLAALREKLQAQYPGHKVVGTYSPPFRTLTAEEDQQIVRQINDARPDVLWVGLGLPKQERWIHEHKHRLKVPIAIGVGACFGFFSGRVKRAPLWIGRIGFEWLWRLACEPKKLWRRDILDAPQFVGHVLMEMTGLRKYD